MATRRQRGIHVLVTINVPANAPIDAVLPTAESKAATVLERSRVLGGVASPAMGEGPLGRSR